MCLPVGVDEVLHVELQEFEAKQALNEFMNIISVIQMGLY